MTEEDKRGLEESIDNGLRSLRDLAAKIRLRNAIHNFQSVVAARKQAYFGCQISKAAQSVIDAFLQSPLVFFGHLRKMGKLLTFVQPQF